MRTTVNPVVYAMLVVLGFPGTGRLKEKHPDWVVGLNGKETYYDSRNPISHHTREKPQQERLKKQFATKASLEN